MLEINNYQDMALNDDGDAMNLDNELDGSFSEEEGFGDESDQLESEGDDFSKDEQ